MLVDACAVCSSGGISLKPSSGMDAMRADMGGAATVCSAIVTAAALNLPLNIIGKCVCVRIQNSSFYKIPFRQ